MPETLHQSEIDSKTDPSVSKQYDNETPKEQQIKEFFEMVDGKKIGILSTYRNGVGELYSTYYYYSMPDITTTGPVGRSMAVAKRTGPDFLFLGNKHATKFSDLDQNKEVQITFQDSKTQDWISVSGTATTTSNSDPRIKDVWSQGTKAWFGDLGDGKHTGGPEDPRMTLIEVKSKYITYYKTEVGRCDWRRCQHGQATRAACTGH
jgi:general stress protein 26